MQIAKLFSFDPESSTIQSHRELPERSSTIATTVPPYSKLLEGDPSTQHTLASEEFILHTSSLAPGINAYLTQISSNVYLTVRRSGSRSELFRFHMNGDGMGPTGQRLPATRTLKNMTIQANGTPECITLSLVKNTIIESFLRWILCEDGESSAITFHIPLGRQRPANPDMAIHIIVESQETIVRPS